MTVQVQTIAIHAHLAGKTAVSRVETGEVFQTGHIGKVVEGNYLEIKRGIALVKGTQHAATDAAVTVEGDAVRGSLGHSRLVLCELEAGSQDRKWFVPPPPTILSRPFSAAVMSQNLSWKA